MGNQDNNCVRQERREDNSVYGWGGGWSVGERKRQRISKRDVNEFRERIHLMT